MRGGPGPWVVVLAALALGCSAGPPPHVVVVVFDTARADHFSAYGYDGAQTPHFDAFAADGILFENAYSTSSWTVPSHASLFTGLYPMAHGATQVSQYLDDAHDTLAERLAAAGYETVAFSNNAWVGEKANLTQGFERVAEGWRVRRAGQAARTNKLIERWLDGRDAERPFFLFVNYIEPHWPYDAPPLAQSRLIEPTVSLAERKAANFGVVSWYLDRTAIDPTLLPLRRRLYDAEMLTVDRALGDLLRMLRERGVVDRSLVVVAADHGEALGDNGHQGHSFTLYDTTLRVPLAIRAPGGAGGGTRRAEPVQLTDVFATVAAAAGLRERGVGSDLLAGALPADRPIVGEYDYPEQFIQYFPDSAREGPVLAPYLREIRSLRVGPHKLIWGSDGRHELYDLAADPGESRDLAAERPDLLRGLERRLAELVERHARGDAAAPAAVGELDPDVEQSLRDLGYVR